MNDTRPSPDSRAREIFLEVLEQPTPEERAACLERACAGDPTLRAAVEALLQNHKDANAPGPSAVEVQRSDADKLGPGGTVVVDTVTEKAGDRIGRYKLLQEIGEGGCGTVYMAEQEEPVRRRVALKVIKLGMDTKSVIARFEAERQALAMMDHPNIAKVLDAGTTDTGRPYFVMELVRGIRITEYCDQNNLSTEERLKLFIQVCQAIQHAHQKGVIHRDIKPSNMLVTLHDGVPVPLVIDFGIAKAIGQRLTDKTLFTEFQAFVGTPAYMSPEQAEMSGLDIDTRSDIYSLGVLLYELLTGQTPFDADRLMRSGLDEMRRIIREEEPLRPSTRLSTMAMAPAAALAKTRREKIPVLADLVRGDVDWIVMKCLEKDRARRYATANSLAMDVQRYLDGELVLARPPSTAYRVQKFIRRNKVMVTAVAVVALVLVAGVVVSSWQAIRATRAERDQNRLRKAADASRQNEARQRLRAETGELAALRQAYNSDMNLVQQALAANNLGRVNGLLNRHRPKAKSKIQNPKSETAPDFRQWEWRYFWNQSRTEAAFVLPQQSNSITTVAISPDGQFMASSDMRGTLKLWDLFRRTELSAIREGGFGSSAFAFSPKGDRLAVAVNAGPRRTTVKVWAVATREVTAEFAPEGGVQLVAFDPDGTKLVILGQAFGQGMAVRIWDFEREQLTLRTRLSQAQGGPRPVAAFSPDAKLVAIADAGGVRLLDAESGVEKSSLTAFEQGIGSLAFSPDGQSLAVGPLFTESETSIKLFSTATGKELGQLVGHVSWVPGLVFTPDGKRLVSAGADETVRIWDVNEHRELAALRGHLSEINCVAVTPDGRTIVSGCKDGTLFGWDAERTERRKPFAILPNRVADIEFFPDGHAMLSINTNGTVSVWDPATLHERERIAELGSGVQHILVSPDGARLYAGARGGQIKVLDWGTRLVLTNLSANPGRSVGLGPGGRGGVESPGGPGGPRGPGGPGGSSGLVGLVDNGRTLVIRGAGSTIRLLDTASWKVKAEWKANTGQPFGPVQYALSPDEHFLLAGGSFGRPVEWLNLQSGQPEATLSVGDWGVSGMAFAPDGRLLATSSREGTVTLWDASKRTVLDVLRGHLLGVHAVAFSPDGQRLASASAGNEAVKLWDAVTRHEVATLAGEGAIFDRLKFSPDGRLLVAINAQGKAHIWRAPTLDDIAASEARASARVADPPTAGP